MSRLECILVYLAIFQVTSVVVVASVQTSVLHFYLSLKVWSYGCGTKNYFFYLTQIQKSKEGSVELLLLNPYWSERNEPNLKTVTKKFTFLVLCEKIHHVFTINDEIMAFQVRTEEKSTIFINNSVLCYYG